MSTHPVTLQSSNVTVPMANELMNCCHAKKKHVLKQGALYPWHIAIITGRVA